MMNEIIRLENIGRSYKTKGSTLRALDNINLSVPEGSYTAITGQSGSGKSTLMNILGCLDKPDFGEYYLCGSPVSGLSEAELSFVRRSLIGFIFQSFHLIPGLTALENVELPLLYRRESKARRHAAALSALKRVGLLDRTDHLPSELSGGQQQRVAVARAIAAEPRILLADEPTGSLDKASGLEVMDMIEELNREGVTVIVITHDSGIADRAKRRVTISDGKIA